MCVIFLQADVLQAAKDISSILAEEHNKKKKVLHPNEMAALALTLNPVMLLLLLSFLLLLCKRLISNCNYAGPCDDGVTQTFWLSLFCSSQAIRLAFSFIKALWSLQSLLVKYP